MNTCNDSRASNLHAPKHNETTSVAAGSRDDRFLAMLGHEMRNPLSALSNALELWPNITYDALELAGLRGLMQRQVEQLVRLSDDLVNFAHGERMLDFRRTQLDLKQTVEAACEEVRPFAERRGHKLAVNLPEGPIFVCGDALRLIQAVANLIQNAAKFMERIGCIDVIVERQADWAAVRVRDNGAGIESHRLPSIFEAHPERSREYGAANEGLGIGLPLVKKIVDEHGGKITAYSDGPGQGSEFTVYLLTQSVASASEIPVSASLAVYGTRNSIAVCLPTTPTSPVTVNCAGSQS